MKKTKPKKLLTVLLALCMVLSIVPITAFAVEIDFLPQGVTYLNDYKHTHHTQVNVTANVSVKDSDGTVVETTQVSKSTEEFLKGGVGMLQSNIARLQTEIETPYQASGTVTRGDRGAQTIFDHFETASFYTFTPASGDPVKFSTDLDAAKQYFSEHPDATGTFTKLLDVHEYQKYNYTYDLTVQENSQPASTITSAVVKNVKFNYQPGDAPQATAEVYNDDADKYEIAYECWQEFENNEPVAAWYSDNGSHGSLPKITEFESGKKYVYFLMLKPKDGYSFNSETTVTVNGESVKSSLSGEYLYVPAVKTITPTKQNSTLTAIDVENVKLDYQPGDAPQASAKKAGTNQDKYDISYECWEKLEKDANDTLNSDGYWYSDESCYSDGDVRFSTFEKGGRYKYSVKLQAKDGYTFDSNLTNTENVTLNGASLPSFGSWVMVMDDGKTCLIVYGTELRPGQAVEKIDFIARTNFNAGDKPSFMTSAVDPFIDLDHERWDANDGSGYGITSSDYWNKRYNGKLITEFEAGKSYTYGVYFKISDLGMEEGYRFDKNTKLYINGEEITLTPDQISIDDSGETIWFMNVLTMTPTTVKVIDVVEINDATVSFKDGDKPVFTGDVPDDVYYVLRAAWWELDSKTGAISADFFSGAYENKITAFEAGKTYHYGVYVVAYGDVGNIRYTFGPDTKLKINGEFVNYTRYEGDDSDGSDGTMWVLTDLTMTPAADGHTHKYGTEWKYDETNHWHECECGNKADITTHTFKQIIDKEATATEKGSKHEECTVCGYKKAAVDIPKIDSHNHNYGTEWKYDSTNHWHECEDGEKADITAHNFKWIIDKEATTAEKGSKHEECTVCGYKKTAVDIPVTDFRNSSDDQPNKPINTASSESSSADQTNKPINTASPKTGNTDNMILWIVLLVIGGGAFITATAVDRKKK